MYKEILLLFIAAICLVASDSTEVSGNYDQISEFNFIFKGMFPEDSCCGEEGCPDTECGMPPDFGPSLPMCYHEIGGMCESVDYINVSEFEAEPIFSISPEMVMSNAPFMVANNAAFYGHLLQEGEGATAMFGETTTGHLFVDGDLTIGGALHVGNEGLPCVGPFDSDEVSFKSVHAEHSSATYQYASMLEGGAISVESELILGPDSILQCPFSAYNLCAFLDEVHTSFWNPFGKRSAPEFSGSLVNQATNNKYIEEQQKYLNTAGAYFHDISEDRSEYCSVYRGSKSGGKLCKDATSATARTELQLPNGAGISEIECHFTDVDSTANIVWSLIESSLTDEPEVLVKMSSSAQEYDESSPLRQNSFKFHQNPIVVNTAINTYELEVEIAGKGAIFHKCSIIYQ